MKNNKKIAIVIISTLFFTYTIQSMANEPNTKSSTANFKAQLSERLRMHQQSPNESDDEDDMETDIKSQQQFAGFKKHQNSNNKYVSKIFAPETLLTKVPRIPDKENNTTPNQNNDATDDWDDDNISTKDLTFQEKQDIIGQKLGPIFAAKSKTNTKQPTGNNVKKPVIAIPSSNTTPIATTHSNDNISTKDLTFQEKQDIIGQKLGPIFAAKSKTNTKQPTGNNVKKPVTAILKPNTTPIATTHSNDNISTKDLTFQEKKDIIGQKLGPIFAAKSKTNTKQPTGNNVKKPVTAIPNTNTTSITTHTHQTLICSGQSNAEAEDIYYDAEDNQSNAATEDTYYDAEDNQSNVATEDIYYDAEDNQSNAATEDIYYDAEDNQSNSATEDIYYDAEDVLDCSANQPSLLPPSTINNSAVQPLNNNNQQFDNSEQNKTIESEIKVKAYFKEQEKVLLKAAQTNDIATTSAITAVTATTVSAITSSISKMCQNHRNIISSGSNINNNTSWSIQGKIFSTAINPNESTENNKYNLKSNGIFVTSNKYLTEKIIIGITGLYANSAINYDQSVLTATDCTTYSLSLNGRYYLQRNIFIQGITGFINYDGKNKYTTQSSSKISGESYYGDFMLGCDLHHTNSQLILSPIVGIRYNRIYNSSYELFDDITIGSMNHNTLVGSVGFSTKYTINNISKNISVRPEFQALIHTNLYTNSSNNIMLEYANSINYSDVDNAKPISIDTKPICQLGAAITLLLTNKIELGGSYNIYFAEKYIVKVSTISMKANF
ncbi:autotransporter domain-containing protein [Orientia tsutsugamushi]|uniref:autotransporter domain-containing protein n=1 Tax=Orientia tsutsugamushi TaxID=784 RepID=UPI000D5A2DE9|nr:ScaD autotransporter protein [Orientia tsutsugamushi]